MKKFTRIMFAVIACLTLTCFAACNGGSEEKTINVIGRDATSGTRSAFEELIKDTDGTALTGKMVSSAEELQGTSAVIAKVSTNKTAIGYISLGSLDSTVKALKVNGVAPTVANIENNSYSLWRPFVILTNKTLTDAGNLSAVTKDFLAYLKSNAASSIIAGKGYVPQTEKTAFTSDKSTGTVVLRGSTSVETIMNVLMDEYKKLNPNVTFDKNCNGSGEGRTAAKNDTVGNVIGMSSSAIKATDAPSFVQFNLAIDAVAVIVNNDNALESVTTKNIFDIYTGALTKFSEIK